MLVRVPVRKLSVSDSTMLISSKCNEGDMMQNEVEVAIERIRPELISRGSDVELLRTTNLGVVHVNLSGECCSGQMIRLMTIIEIEGAVKKQVPGVKIVTE